MNITKKVEKPAVPEKCLQSQGNLLRKRRKRKKNTFMLAPQINMVNIEKYREI